MEAADNFTSISEIRTNIVYYAGMFQTSDYTMTPDIFALSESLNNCLQESEEVPADFTQLFHAKVKKDKND